MNWEPQRITRWDTKHIHLELLAQFIFTYKVALKVNPHAPANKQATKASALFFVRLGYGFCDAVLQRALLKLHTTLKYFCPHLIQKEVVHLQRVHKPSLKYTGNFKPLIVDQTENNAMPPSMSLVIEIQGEGGWDQILWLAFCLVDLTKCPRHISCIKGLVQGKGQD